MIAGGNHLAKIGFCGKFNGRGEVFLKKTCQIRFFIREEMVKGKFMNCFFGTDKY